MINMHACGMKMLLIATSFGVQFKTNKKKKKKKKKYILNIKIKQKCIIFYFKVNIFN